MVKNGDTRKHSAVFFNSCMVALILLSLYLIRGYVVALVSAFVLAFIFYPLYKKILGVVKNDNAASLITALIVIVITVVPLIFAANAIIKESVELFHVVKDFDTGSLDEKLGDILDREIELESYIRDGLNKIFLFLGRSTSDLLETLPHRIVSLFVMFFALFYLLKEGKNVAEKIQGYIPLKESYRDDVIRKFSDVTYASLYGIVVTAFIQGAIGAIGLWIFGVPSPILWGLVMAIASMLPFLGPYLVWLPAAFIQMASGNMFQGVGLLLYGVFIVSTVDNVVRPKIIGRKGKIHPLLVLLGVLGGLEVFGLLGVIIGPLILALMTVFVQLFFLEKNS